MELKYIRGRYGFAIFDAGQSHADMARGMHEKPESAGFCTVAVGYRRIELDDGGLGEEEQFVNVHCFGESMTLKLKSREEDGEEIEHEINNYY